jgi:hypothetical protein
MWNYIVNLFHRSLNNHPLTPRERAFMKSMQGVLIGFLVDAGPQLYAVVGGHAKFNFSNAVVAALVGALVAYMLKLWQAQGDGNLSALLDAYAQAKAHEALGSLTVPSEDGSLAVPAMQIVLPLARALVMQSEVKIAQPASNPVGPSVGSVSAPTLNSSDTVAMPAVSTSFPLPGTSIHDLPTADVPAVHPNP